MADYTKRVKKLLSDNKCTFVRYGKGDHEIWYSPMLNRNFSIDGKIVDRHSANEMLKDAGIRRKL